MCQETELSTPSPATTLEPGPVADAARIDSLDVLRGFAVLGILVMNIQAFSMIGPAYDNPSAYGEISKADYRAWLVPHILFSQKFMTIFSMLFGAGILLMSDRRETAGRPSASVHYRRMGVLLLFGLLHAYLIWHGDVLFLYAVSGLLVYLFRRWRPSVLISMGLVSIVLPTLLCCAIVWTVPFWPEDQIRQFLYDWTPAQERLDAETAAFLGGWWDQMPERTTTALMLQTAGMLWAFWLAGGLMCIGMALFKLGVFSARRSAAFYLTTIAVTLPVGIPVILYGVRMRIEANWDPIYCMFLGSQYNYLVSILISMAWISLIMLICKHRTWPSITRPLAAVGRMALTNYLMQSVICTMIFYGHGLGLFGQVSRVGQLGVVLGVLVFQLIVSPLWMRRFRFGPMEWLWRSLTYRRRQPMLRT